MANFELNVKINGVEQSVKSIGELEKALAETKGQLAGVEVGTREFKFLENQAKNLDKVMQSLSGDAKTLNNSLSGVNTTAKELNNSFTQTAAAAAELGTGTKVKGLNEDIKVAASSSQSLRTELRKITQELQGLEPGSARFQELSLRAGALRDTIADTSGVIGSLVGTSVERLGKALQTTLQIGVAGFQGLIGATALFGAESEEIQKTLVKLTALLNLAAAIETFGGLGDKITEIKAGFTSLFPAATAAAAATSALAVAEGAEGVAATGAAAGTTAFAVALNALPLVAIITGIGLLIAGLIKYAGGADEAKKADEARKKTKEALIAAEKEERSVLAKSESGFVLLINQLRSTNAGSKERKELIDQINSKYNTTLQNLSDERAFQRQLNLEVATYIAFQKARFQLEKNDRQSRAQLEYQDKLNDKINQELASRKKVDAEILKQEKRAEGNLVTEDFADNLRELQVKQKQANDEIANFQKQIKASDALLLSYGKTNLDVSAEIKKIQGETNKYDESLKKVAVSNTKVADTEKDKVRAQQETLDNIVDFGKKTKAAEEDLERDRLARTKDRRDDIEFDKNLRLADLQQEYDAQKKAIDDNVFDQQKAAIAKTNLTALFTKRQEVIIQSSADKTNAINKESAESQKKFIEELILAQKVLETETTFGNNNVADQKEALIIKQNQAILDSLEIELQSNKLSRAERLQTENLKRIILQETADLQIKVANETATTEGQLQISETIKYYQTKTNLETGTNQFIITQNKKTGEVLVQSNQKYLEEVEKDGEGAAKKATEEAALVEDVINKQRLNINAETTSKIQTNDIEANNRRIAEAIETERKIAAERIKIVQSVIFFAQQAVALATELEAGISADEEVRLNQSNEAFAKSQQAKADAIEAAYQQDILRNNFTEDQKRARRLRADKDIKDIQKGTNDFIDKNNTDLAKKQFARNKAIQISNAIINGAQAALAGIAQLGPPPLPAGIAAIASAAIITAAQIATISKQKFDGGSTGASLQISTPDTGSATPAGSGLNQLGGGFTTFSEGATGTPGAGMGSSQVPFEGQSQRVFVVESDITEAQMRVRVLEDNSTFG